MADFGKLKKTMKIFAVVQAALIALLIFMAVNFQTKLRLLHREHNFMQGVIFSFIVQLVLFYPIYRFARKEAERDLTLSGSPSTAEVNAIFKKKRFADVLKVCVFLFFLVFLIASPSDPQALSIIYYSFVLTILTYLQCYNFSVKKLMQK